MAPRLMSESESVSPGAGEWASPLRRELPLELASCEPSWCCCILQHTEEGLLVPASQHRHCPTPALRAPAGPAPAQSTPAKPHYMRIRV